MTTEELLERLYSIRTGLSVVTQQAESYYSAKWDWLIDMCSIGNIADLSAWLNAEKKGSPDDNDDGSFYRDDGYFNKHEYGDYHGGCVVRESIGNSDNLIKSYVKYADANIKPGLKNVQIPTVKEAEKFKALNIAWNRSEVKNSLFYGNFPKLVESRKSRVLDDLKKFVCNYIENNKQLDIHEDYRLVDVDDSYRTGEVLVDYQYSLVLFDIAKCKYDSYYTYCTIFDREIIIRMVKWLTSDECERYLDERTEFFQNEKTGKIFKKLAFPDRLKQITELKSMIPEIKERVKAAERLLSEQTEGVLENAKAIYDAVKAEYSPLLDIRDWKNLDLIIYAIETHRAENLKEALMYVDGEVRTKRITSAIEEAAKAIQQAISEGFSSLQSTVERCCDAITARISETGNKLSGQMSALIAAENMSNALQKKANISSENLVREVSSINNLLKSW